MNGVRAVLLDAGNTLVFVSPTRMLEIFDRCDLTVEEATFREAELDARLSLTRRLGQDPAPTGTEAYIWQEYFEAMFRTCGVPEGRLAEVGERVKTLHATDHLWTHVHDETPAALAALKDAGYRLAVISNADGRVPALLEQLGLREHFEFVIDSGEVGVEKPDRRIFDMAVERLDLPPEACLYVGDLYPVDVLGARRAGLQAVLVDPWDVFGDQDVDRIRSVGRLPAYLGAEG